MPLEMQLRERCSEEVKKRWGAAGMGLVCTVFGLVPNAGDDAPLVKDSVDMMALGAPGQRLSLFVCGGGECRQPR